MEKVIIQEKFYLLDSIYIINTQKKRKLQIAFLIIYIQANELFDVNLYLLIKKKRKSAVNGFINNSVGQYKRKRATHRFGSNNTLNKIFKHRNKKNSQCLLTICICFTSSSKASF